MECIICKNEMRHLSKDLFQCKECELISSNIEPELSIYDRSYEIKYDRYERTDTGKKIQYLRWETVKKHVPDNLKLNLLDFGCGVGSFVKMFFTERNIKAYGFDINPYTQFCDVSVFFRNYDIVTFWDSLEHLRDPAKIIKGLNPKYLFACTPSTDDCFGNITDWRHYMPCEHAHYFNRESITAFLNGCGYKVIAHDYDESEPRNGGGAKNILTVAAEREDNGTH